jgi:hypothetical protein
VSGSNVEVVNSGSIGTLSASGSYTIIVAEQGGVLDITAGVTISVENLSTQQGGYSPSSPYSIFPGGIVVDGGVLDNTGVAVIGGLVEVENGGAASLNLASPNSTINGVPAAPGTIDIVGASSVNLSYAQGVTAFGGLFDYANPGGTPEPGGTATVNDIVANLGSFADFTAGDTIDLTGYASGTTFNVTPLTLAASVPAGEADTVIAIPSIYNLTDTIGGTTSTIATINAIDGSTPVFNTSNDTVTACYAAGTRILTVRGEVAIEDLRVGDLVVTFAGSGAPLKPVRWVGYRHVDLTTHPSPEQVRPVRLAAGTLAPGLPHRDLVLSPGHAICIDDQLIDVERLLNGVTVTQDMEATSVTYYHIELDEHDLVLAEGVFSETYLDTGNRGQFANAGNIIALHPDFLPQQDKAVGACRPWLTDGPRLAAIRARLIGVITADGYRVTEEADLHLEAGGWRGHPEAADAAKFRFTLPRVASDLHLRSRVWMPGGLSAESEDMRRLGVRVRQMVAIGPAGRRAIALDDPALGTGFYPVERDGDDAWRWTNGAALIPAGLLGDATALEVTLAGTGSYWEAPAEENADDAMRLSA